MGREIERKFKVAGTSWRRARHSTSRIRQGYLSRGDLSVRVRIVDDRLALIGIKSAGADPRTRAEFEYPIPLKDARQLLRLAAPNVLGKRRHTLTEGGKTWVIDEFEGRLKGLVLAEIELSRRNEAFPRPDWLGEEVTGNPQFSNSQLAASHP